jgi:hypothetical protein
MMLAVTEFFIQLIVVLPIFVLWPAVVAVLARPFGVRFPFLGFRKNKGTSQSLTFAQHLWLVGVLGWGCGVWMVLTLSDLLDWKYWNGPAHDLSAARLLLHAVTWALGGLVFGWLTWNTRMGKGVS